MFFPFFSGFKISRQNKPITDITLWLNLIREHRQWLLHLREKQSRHRGICTACGPLALSSKAATRRGDLKSGTAWSSPAWDTSGSCVTVTCEHIQRPAHALCFRNFQYKFSYEWLLLHCVCMYSQALCVPCVCRTRRGLPRRDWRLKQPWVQMPGLITAWHMRSISKAGRPSFFATKVQTTCKTHVEKHAKLQAPRVGLWIWVFF